MNSEKTILQAAPLGEAASLYLDVLRSIISQLVLLGHGISFYGVMELMQPPNFPWIQSIAVVGFFWLSGSLICHSVLLHKQRNREYRFSDFFFARFARIYTGFVPALLFVLLMDWVFIEMYPDKYEFYSSFSLNVAISNFFMLQKFPVEYFYAPMFGSASTWWTLGIEWWLYMLFGWIFVLKKGHVRGEVYWSVLLLVSIVPVNYAVRGTGYVGIGLSLVWFIAYGFAVAKDMICENLSRDLMFAGAVILLILAVARYMVSMDAYDFIASMYLGMAFLLSTCWAQGLTVQINRSLKKVVHFIAGYSFTLFLTHYSVLYFINATGLFHGWAALLTSFLASNLIAVLIAYWTEMRYRDFAIFLRKQWANLSAYSPGKIE